MKPGTLTALLQEIASAPQEAQGAAWEATLRPGARVGRFELVRELGRGGFGVVWEARDRELGRSVAFKAVRAGGKTSVREERLLREAEAAARLSHPNIVTLHDVGRAEAGPYLILELLRGQNLAERLGQGLLPVAEAVRVAVEVAKGLAHAHGQGVVHRDLKPENVFLCEDGQVKVLDFGLAHAFGRRRAEGGTSGFMAPEQAEGAPEDERTDVFALAVILFEMLSGQLPFPDEKALRSVSRAPALEVPGEPALGELVSRMLAKRPVERPRDGGEVLSALSLLAGELERAPTTGPVRTRRRPGLRLASLLVAGIAIGVGIAAAGVWWAARAGRLARTSSIAPSPAEPVALAVLPLANLSGDVSQEYFSDGMTEEIIGKLSRLRGLAVTARSSVAKYKGSTRGAREIGKELGVAYLLEGSVRRAGERIRISATLVKAADGFQVWSENIDARLDDIFDAQERVATRIVEALHVRLSPEEAGSLGSWGTRNAAAYDEYLRGQVLVEHFHEREKLEAARGHFERALEIDTRFAPAMAGLASAEAMTYRNVDSTPDHLKRARALVERALAIDPHLTRALFALGEIRGVSYDYEGAGEAFRQVTAQEPRNYLAWDYLCWVLGYVTPPQVAEAEKACRRAIEINPAYGESYYHLARVLIPQGRFPEAEQALGHLAEHFPGSYLLHGGQFWLHLGAKRPRKALAALEQDRQLRGTSLGRAWTAMALAQIGELDRAFAALDQAMALGYRDAPDLRTSRHFEPLRRDRRFASLLAKYGIAPRAQSSIERPSNAREPPPAVPSPSIAVLPFTDMSPGKDQEYFGDGIAEEILNALAQVEGLRVSGRTSSFSFKGTNRKIAEIGRELNVGTVLEGSVRKAGGRIRITAQVSNVSDGYHRWSKSFDRELTDVFAVQEEIARAVVDELKVKLVPGKTLATGDRRTASAEAYTQYLIGRQVNFRHTAEGYRRAKEAFERALAIDPGYAPARAQLAMALRALSYSVEDARAVQEYRRRAPEEAERAVALGPDLAEAYASRGLLRFAWMRDWSGAESDLRRALELSPGDSPSRRRRGMLLAALGRMPEALVDVEKATKLDPLDATAAMWLGVLQTASGRCDLGRASQLRALEISPESDDAHGELARCGLLEGRYEDALAEVATVGKPERLLVMAIAHRELGHAVNSRAALDELVARHAHNSAELVAAYYAWAGDADHAFEWLERALNQELWDVKFETYLRKLHNDPRWNALLRKMNLPVD